MIEIDAAVIALDDNMIRIVQMGLVKGGCQISDGGVGGFDGLQVFRRHVTVPVAGFVRMLQVDKRKIRLFRDNMPDGMPHDDQVVVVTAGGGGAYQKIESAGGGQGGEVVPAEKAGNGLAAIFGQVEEAECTGRRVGPAGIGQNPVGYRCY